MLRSDRKVYYSNPGSRVKVLYSPVMDEGGNFHLEKSGETDIYEEIQSHRESTELSVLLKRFQNGEYDVLSKAQGFYADVSDAPRSYAEVLQRVKEGESTFSALPADVRNKFGNSFECWFATIGSEDWFKAMGIAVSDSRKPSDPDSGSDGSEQVTK